MFVSVTVCAGLVTFVATLPNARLGGDTVALTMPAPLSFTESLFEAFALSVTCSVTV